MHDIPLSRFNSLVPAMREAVRDAGALALRWFRPGADTSARRWTKERGSPVTEADVAVDAFLKVRLLEILPQAAWLSEETADNPARLGREAVWIVDPIDGTRAFMSGHPDWCVAVALLMNGEPIHGLVYAPAADSFYEASAGGGARRDGKKINASPTAVLAKARAAGPKPLLDTLERRSGDALTRLPKIPSLALRIVRVAEGSIDVGLASSDARDWDLAAADLILREAGGRMTDLSGGVLVYNRPDPTHGELAAAPERLHSRVLEAMRASTNRAPRPGQPIA